MSIPILVVVHTCSLPEVTNNRLTETEAYATTQPIVSYTPHPLKENTEPTCMSPKKQKSTKNEVHKGITEENISTPPPPSSKQIHMFL